jgi:hypothetical protein
MTDKSDVPAKHLDTPWDRLDQAFRAVLTVPKERLLKEESRLKRLKKRKRAQKPS